MTKMTQLKMNTCAGTPGEINFRFKLPKYVTKASLTKATNYLKPAYEFYGNESGLNFIDYFDKIIE